MINYALAERDNSMWLFPKRKKEPETNPKAQDEIEAIKREFKETVSNYNKSNQKTTETLKNKNKDIAFYIYYANNPRDRS